MIVRYSSFWFQLIIIFLLSYCNIVNANYTERFSVTVTGNKLYYSIDLEPGHKIYWLSPGDSGQATTIDFSGSTNLDDAVIYWPLPKIDNISPEITNYVYQGELIIPVYISAKNASKAVHINAKLNYLICYEMCVPVEQTISTGLVASQEMPSYNKFDISDIKFKDDILSLQVSFDQAVHNPQFMIAAKHHALVTGVTIQQYSTKDYLVKFTLDKNKYSATDEPELKIYSDKAALPVIITQDDIVTPTASLLSIICFALIGGFILNFMPCVLPVLALKILSVQNSATSRLTVLMSFLGILASFFALSLISISAKHAGVAFGLGINFQQPAFIIALAIIIVMFISMVIGRLQLPISPAMMNYLYKLHASSKYINSFITGVVSTILATPCTAPFLGTAVSFAVLADDLTNIIIFLFIGVGFGLPYILMMVAPGTLRYLPKPGKWLISFKYFLALLLVGTLVWLLYILGNQLDLKAALVLLMILFILKYMLECNKSKFISPTIKYIAIIGLICGCFYLPFEVYKDDKKIDYARSHIWQEFNEQRIKDHIKEGKIVVIDITADWCMTCKFNKMRVLNRAKTVKLLQQENVVAMRGDITTPDSDIQKFMAKHKVFAIPINIVYGPGAEDGIILPTIISYDDFAAAIQSAK